MRRAAWIAICLLGVAGGPATADGPTTIELEGPERVTQLLREDVTGDGVMDVVLAAGRDVYVWSGGKGKLPGPKPVAQKTVPPTVSFVDAGASGELVGIAPTSLVRIPLSDAEPKNDTRPDIDIDWSASQNLVFVDFHRDAGLLLPFRGAVSGFALVVDDEVASYLETKPARYVEEAGPFLEDTATAATEWPYVELARLPDGRNGTALWAFDGDRLVAQRKTDRVEYDLSFLPHDGHRVLVDLDADGLPDVVHVKTSNREGQYGFFHTPPAETGSKTGPPHAPARSFLRLSGFQLDPEFVDVNDDGLLDFVMTSMEIDAKNTLRAMTSGLVTAQTRLFLNRADGAKGRYFEGEPDATVTSDVGVDMRFTYAGTIEVTRSLTLVVDGDYDGDGRLDLAIRIDADTVRIQRGMASGGWEAEGREITIPSIGSHTKIEGYAVDTNGDGKDELLLVYRAEAGQRERLVLVAP